VVTGAAGGDVKEETAETAKIAEQEDHPRITRISQIAPRSARRSQDVVAC
jgi:hypothetical protein